MRAAKNVLKNNCRFNFKKKNMDFSKPWYNSVEYKCSYLRMYKSASTSIIDSLGEYSQDSKPMYYKKFTVLRDPFTRAASIHRQLVDIGKTKLDFTSFLMEMAKKGFTNPHMTPQSEMIKQWLTHDMILINTFYLDEIEKIKKFIGISEDFKHLNVKQKKLDAFTVEQIRLITNIYDIDFVNWSNRW